MKYIDQYVDKLRNQYAKDWFYFRNNPDLTAIRSVDDRIELELWALWLLDQEFKVIEKPETLIGPSRSALGKDRIPLNHPILKHLVKDLYVTNGGIIDLEYSLQRGLLDGGPIGEALFPNEVRTEKELKVLTDWAKMHPGKDTYGKPGFKPRTLGTISDPTTIFGDQRSRVKL
jgi:hypothetical protein